MGARWQHECSRVPYHPGLTHIGHVSSPSCRMGFTSMVAPPQAFVASLVLTVTLVWQRWAQAAFSHLLVTVEMRTEVGWAGLFCS